MKRKKILSGILFSIGFLFFASCGIPDHSSWMENNDNKKVLSTTAMIGDLVQQIGKEHIEHIVLIQGELDPHSYELVKGDNEKLARADCIFYNGLGLEHGASLSSYLSHNKKAISIGEVIRKKAPSKMILNQGVIDPHVWMDASLWAEGVDEIVYQLAKLIPEKESVFISNGKQLKKRILDTHEKVRNLIQAIPETKRYLVTSHDAFHYFTRAYLAGPDEGSWEKRVAAPEGLAPDGAISPVDIKNILTFLNQHQVNVVFPESNVSKASLEKIRNDAFSLGLNIRIADGVLYGDAMPKAKENEISYLKMLLHNSTMISEYCHGRK